FTTFDPTGSAQTIVMGLNSSGAATGFYRGADGHDHGFIRAASGAITSFDAASGADTTPQALNDSGVSAGVFDVATTTLPAPPAASGAAGTAEGGGVAQASGNASDFTVLNTIIARNSAAAQSPDISGDFNSLGHNLIGNGSGSTGFVNGHSGDQIGTAAAP